MQLFSGPITIDTPLDKGVIHFRSMTAREVLGQPFLFDLDVFSKRADIKPSELLGLPVTVHLETVYFGMRHFSGLVARLEYRGTGNEYSNYRIVLRPWFWFLGHSVNSRVFQGKSAPDIIKIIFREYAEPPPGSDDPPPDKQEQDPPKRKVARGAGMHTDFAESLSEKYLPLEYVVQYRETDLAFVTRLMERAGIYYFFKHYLDKHELVLADSYSAHHPVAGYTSIPYLPPDSHRHATIEYIDDWRLSGQALPGIHTQTDYDFTRPGLPLLGTAPAPHPHAAASLEYYEYPGRFLENPEGNTISKLRLQQLQAPYEVVLGTSVARGLTTGCLFNLTDHPRPEQNKEHLVIASECELRGHDLTSGGADNLTFRCAFEARDAQVPFRLPITTEKPVMRGPQTAVVVGKNTEEIWTDEYGRVKVQFYWDREGMWDENSSCFIRVAQIWGGDGWGGQHIPRIGQEVIVDFLEGDPDQPIITGRVYCGKETLPYKLTKFQNQSGIKSRSTKNGTPDNFNEIRFDDTKDAEDFFMQAERTQTILVKNNQTTTVKGNRSATITKSDSVGVGGDRSVSVTGNLSITVKGKGKSPNHHDINVTGKSHLHASDTIEIDAPTHIRLTVGNTYILIEPAKITLEAEGKGKIVLDAHVLAQSSDESKVVLDANAFVQSSGKSSMTLDANACVQSSGKSQMLLDGDASVSTNGTVGLTGAKITGNGKQEVGLAGGGSTLSLTAASADLAGKQVNVNGQGVVSIGGPMVKIG
jgi:type VI secretion system secreted protein VgrG